MFALTISYELFLLPRSLKISLPLYMYLLKTLEVRHFEVFLFSVSYISFDLSAQRSLLFFCRLLCLSVPMSVRLSVTPLQIASSLLFFDGIEPFLAASSLFGTLQNAVLRFLI